MRTFDVVVTADFSAANSTAVDVVDAIKVLLSVGYRVGLAHSGGVGDAAFTTPARELLHNTSADFVLPSDEVDTQLLIICSPEAFAEPEPLLPTIAAGQAVVIGDTRRSRLPQREVEARVAERVSARPDSVQWDPAAFGKHVEERIGEATAGGPGDPTSATERRSGVLIIDLTGPDRPDTLLPAVRRETTDPSLPRVVATSAENAAEHAGDLAVETFPRIVGEMTPEPRAAYLAERVTGLLRSHRPQSVFVLDDGSAGFDVAEVARTEVKQAWRVAPGEPSDDLADPLAQRVDSVLPQGWSVAPLESQRSAGSGGGSGFLAAVKAKLRRWTSALRSGFARRSLPSGTLVVAPQLHSNPEQAVRALRQKQIETGGLSVTLLAPPDWEPAAAKHGIPIETLIPEPTWHTIYGAGWVDYVSERVHQARAAVNAASVVFAENLSATSPALQALAAVAAKPSR